MTECLTIIPARGGSKGIPRKNMVYIGPYPLIQFTITAALKAHLPGRICLTTDDPEIREFGLSFPIESPFLRPSDLAQDSSSTHSVIEHTLRWYKENDNYCPDYIILLQPTSPFRTPNNIIESFQLIESSTNNSLIGVNPVSQHPCEYIIPSQNGFKYVMKPPAISGRQHFPPVYFINGSIYITKHRYFISTGQIYDQGALLYQMDPLEGIDIDEQHDIDYANFIFQKSREDFRWMEDLEAN